jgi:tRNA(Ile)-lysidine synthase
VDLAAFDRRLTPGAAAPIGVAVSGGGDSLAALLATQAWAERHDRRVIVLHVDHGLQPDSGAWAARVQTLAAGLGLECRVMPWLDPKPASGLPAAARQARHTLIADAARDVGARVVVFGHTADDVDEGEHMRAEGVTLGHLGEWRPSPVWPAGRGLFLLRPLLGVRRAALRGWLTSLGQTWIEDPANENLASPRIRARRDLASGAPPSADTPIATEDDPTLARLARSAQISEAGSILIYRDLLTAAAEPVARRLLAAAMTCVGGGGQPPRRDRVTALLERLAAPGPVSATLAGAKLFADRQIIFSREAGAYRRGGEPRLRLERANSGVWDGRFALVNAAGAACDVVPLAGRATTLPPFQRIKLKAWPREVRASLPIVIDETGATTCPILAASGAVVAKSLIADRFLAFCGAISKESEI